MKRQAATAEERAIPPVVDRESRVGPSGAGLRPISPQGFHPQPKAASRLQAKVAEKPQTVVDELAFLKEVRTRDKLRCRKCDRKVIVTLARAANRAEVHHCHGRLGDFRYNAVFALLLCKTCHEKVTGKVNEKWIVVGTVFIDVKGQPCIDARKPVTFQRIA